MADDNDGFTSNDDTKSDFRSLILVFIVIMLTVILLFYSFFTLKNVDDDVDQHYIILDDENDSSECLIYDNVTERKVCELKNTECRDDNCYYSKAVGLEDRSYCDGIKDFEIKTRCLEQIYLIESSE